MDIRLPRLNIHFIRQLALLLLLLTFLARLALAASANSQAVAEFENAARREIDAKRSDEGKRGGGYAPTEAARFLARLEFAANASDSNRLEQMLNEIPNYFSSEEVAKAATSLAESIRKERDAKQDAIAAEISSAIKQAAEAVANARVPADLDQPLQNLARIARRNNYGGEQQSENLRSVQNRIQPAINFVQRWQDFLAAKASNNPNRARDSLQNLLNIESLDFMPRSKLLEELQKFPVSSEEGSRSRLTPDEVNQIVGRAKTLDEIGAVLKELRGKTNSYNNYGSGDPASATIDTLTGIERSYREFQAGLPIRIDVVQTRWPDATVAAVAPLRAQLFLLALPRYLDLPSDLASKSGETVDAFLNRVTAEARRRGDTDLISKTRNLRRLFTFGNSSMTDNSPECQAINSYVAAQNQEAAGQFMLAVISYQNSLRAGSDAIPAKIIGGKLNALRAAHPQEFDEGTKIFVSGPAFGTANGPYPHMSVMPFLSVPAATPGAPTTGSTPAPSPSASPTSK